MSGVIDGDVTIATGGNTIPQPPRLRGAPEEDIQTVQAWVADLHRILAIENNVVGTQRAILEALNRLLGRIAVVEATPPGTFSLEVIDDRVAALLVAGANVTISYNDVANTLTIAATPGPTGATGATGATGPTGAAGVSPISFVHYQAASSTVWTINHNLGFWPQCALSSIGGAEFEAEVLHTSVNQTVVYLATARSGYARLD